MDATVTEETPQAPEEKERGGTLRRLRVPLLAGGLVLALALAATFALLWLSTADTKPNEVDAFLVEETPEVEAAATEVVELLSNYDATTIDQVVERMLEITTGSFRKDFEETFSGGFAEAIKEASASARGQILSGPDVTFRSSTEAVAIVRLQQTVQNDQNPGGRTFLDVMELTLIKTAAGEWKADRVEILGEEET